MICSDVIRRAQDNSSYLRESLELFPDLKTAVQSQSADALIAREYSEFPDEILSHQEEMPRLRRLKRRLHLIIALLDIAQIWDWPEVTRALTDISDFAMHRLLIAGASELGIYSQNPDNPVPGLFILAMGKYGAAELNYSSDIDFCVFYDPEMIKLARPERAERTLIKFVQLLIAGFERITPEGYIFRTDLRLRPDPRSNSIVVSTRTAERYYETIGQNWERAAMIKARVCGGDSAAGQSFINDVLRPFVWRRSLDYAAIEDIHSIKRQIQAREGGENITAAGHNIKLGTGGIREIEFYAQTQQLILGGRRPELRTPRTVEALAALSEGEFIAEEDAKALTVQYAHLRRFEHAAQMREDAQTHISPEDEQAREQLAKLSGYDTLKAFDANLTDVLRDVHGRYKALFPSYESLALSEGTLSFTGVEPHPETLATLQRLQFKQGPRVWKTMATWLGGRIAATRTERARELLTRLAPRLIKICAEAEDPDAAFLAFERFFEKVAGGVSLLAMFLQAPNRLARIIQLMLISPRVSDTLASRPSILDGMISPDFMNVQGADFGLGYASIINPEDDFEQIMNAVRRRLHEDQFRISASVLSGHTPLSDAAALLTKLAQSSLQTLLPVAAQETRRSAGELRGDYAVLALGKAGGAEMSLASDLDIMLIYEGRGEPAQLYTKLTQRLISAVSSYTSEGRLYEVDMALRPSGRSGPVAVSLDAFERYYAAEAWTWEFMALTRARVVAASSAEFSHALQAAVSKAMGAARVDLNMPADIADMLARLRAEKPPRGPWDVKQLGGGVRDIEFIVQSLYLARRAEHAAHGATATRDMLRHAAKLGQITGDDAEAIEAALVYFQNLTQGLALMHGSLNGEVSPDVLKALAALMGEEDTEQLACATQHHQEKIIDLQPKFIF